MSWRGCINAGAVHAHMRARSDMHVLMPVRRDARRESGAPDTLGGRGVTLEAIKDRENSPRYKFAYPRRQMKRAIFAVSAGFNA